jgi:hypothetical protein
MQPISPFFKKGPPILGFWGSGILGFWDSGVLGLWGSGVLGFWGSGALGPPFLKKGGACNPLKVARLIKAPIQKIKREYGGG